MHDQANEADYVLLIGSLMGSSFYSTFMHYCNNPQLVQNLIAITVAPSSLVAGSDPYRMPAALERWYSMLEKIAGLGFGIMPMQSDVIAGKAVGDPNVVPDADDSALAVAQVVKKWIVDGSLHPGEKNANREFDLTMATLPVLGNAVIPSIISALPSTDDTTAKFEQAALAQGWGGLARVNSLNVFGRQPYGLNWEESLLKSLRVRGLHGLILNNDAEENQLLGLMTVAPEDAQGMMDHLPAAARRPGGKS